MKLRIARKVVRLAYQGRHRKSTVRKARARYHYVVAKARAVLVEPLKYITVDVTISPPAANRCTP